MKKLVGEGKPLHSAVDRAAKGLKRKVGTGAEFMKELVGITGIKPTEIQERGLNEVMGMPRMTHDQFMANLSIRPAPAIHEKVLGKPNEEQREQINNLAYEFAYKHYYDDLRDQGEDHDTAEEEARSLALDSAHHAAYQNKAEKQLKIEPSYHGQYTLPGGENYREMLIKMPNDREKLNSKTVELDTKLRHAAPENRSAIMRQIDELKAQREKTPESFPGVSQHFGGEGNILASMRVKDRTGPNGEKLLHLEELQSDWHQQGREKGYKADIPDLTPEQEARIEELGGKIRHGLGTSAEIDESKALRDQAVKRLKAIPDAPFKKNWEEMALKRLIHHAAEKGYHGIVVTPGAEQADRYSLAKHLDRIEFEPSLNKPNTGNLYAYNPQGSMVLSKHGIEHDQLPEHIGKELSQKLLSQTPNADRVHQLSGVNLRTGDEAMKGFYDKKVPNILNSIGKKYGVKTELHGHKLPGDPSQRGDASERLGVAGERLADMSPEQVQAFNQKLDDSNAKQLHYFPITEDMRKDVLTNGLPLYAQGGTVHMAKGDDMDTMKLEMMRRHMAKGGSAKPVDTGKRVTIHAEGSGGVKGIVVPRHTLEGNPKAGAIGLHEMNEARAKVYGEEHREPLTLNKMASMHKKTLADHFAKPLEEQHEAEEAALNRLREAKHIGRTANTLDESEKLDTVRHEEDAQGRTHVGYASKGVAGHALYTSGHGNDTKYNVVNTCPGQTEGCGGGKDAQGIVDTKKGTCFAPNAESQYAAAAVRRAAHAQAKHDPAMTNDWILAHTGSLRNAARLADKGNKRLLFRPNVVDETDVTSRHAIRHLNDQRKAEGKPPIIANSYGKTNELHDPENGYYVTHSNVGPKVKKGESIAENIGRDKARVRNTIMAADNKGDFKNEQGNKTPPKGSYMVTDVKRGSPMAKKMEAHITHAKYWTTGREEHELTPEEKAEGPEGHFGGNGKPTSPDKAHFGHTTVAGKRFDYQKQHILHPRLVQVGENKDGTPHMIPTDSRFKDEEFLPKNRFKTKNGKEAGHILMTTPTESTSNIGHQTSFTHNVSDKHIDHAIANKGEYEIDKPQDQLKAAGKEYSPPQPIKFYAEGGGVGGDRHIGFSDDDFHAFPEQNVVAQRHLAMRDEHASSKPTAKKVKFGDDFEQFKTKHLMRRADGGTVNTKSIGVQEAPNMDIKAYFPPQPVRQGNVLPVGGVEQPQQAPQQPQQSAPAPQGMPQGMPPQGAPAQQSPSNILQMTRQGQAMNAMTPPAPQPQGMARGGTTRRVAYNSDPDAMMLELMQAKRYSNRK
jgi:hypothetical protein